MKIILEIKETKKFNHLSKGMLCMHPDGYLVYITDGFYLDPTYGRVSNHFDWNRVEKDGSLSKKTYSGYGWKK